MYIIRDVMEPAKIRILHVQSPSDVDADLLRDQN